MQERRKTQRRYILYYMRVYDAETRQQIGNLVDITPEGIMIVSEEDIPEGQTMRLQVEITEDVARKPSMEFTARSKWCQDDINPQMKNIGFEILDLAPDDAEIIQHIIAKYGFRDNRPEK